MGDAKNVQTLRRAGLVAEHVLRSAFPAGFLSVHVHPIRQTDKLGLVRRHPSAFYIDGKSPDRVLAAGLAIHIERWPFCYLFCLGGRERKGECVSSWSTVSIAKTRSLCKSGLVSGEDGTKRCTFSLPDARSQVACIMASNINRKASKSTTGDILPSPD